MNVPFPSYCHVTGNNFLSRKKEVDELAAHIMKGEHTLIYDAPKTGKHSLVKEVFLKLEANEYHFIPIHFSFIKSRSEASFITQFATTLTQALTSSDEERMTFETKYLADRNAESVISAPEAFAKDTGNNIVILLDEFQNILNYDQPDSTLKKLENVILSHKHVSYIIMGSRINAMKHIFEDVGYFFNFATQIFLSPIDRKEVENYINRAFVKVGKVISKEFIGKIYDKVQGNPWYIWDIANTCFLLTRGYVTEAVLKEAFDTVMMQHERRFVDVIYSLSNFQLDLLRAVFDGIYQLNSSDTIQLYNLNSSGNVHRLKEALLKKEVISFDIDHRPYIIDPLFRLWLEERYFCK